MMNDYADQFNEETDLFGMIEWFIDNFGAFIPNLKNASPKKRKLKEWIKLFLDWSEYEENK